MNYEWRDLEFRIQNAKMGIKRRSDFKGLCRLEANTTGDFIYSWQWALKGRSSFSKAIGFSRAIGFSGLCRLEANTTGDFIYSWQWALKGRSDFQGRSVFRVYAG